MKAKEVKEMTNAELTAKLAELKGELFNLRFRLASGQLENPVSIRTCKRDKSKHPLYKKTIVTSKRLKAHDEENACGVGDTVRIVETRKLSKDKNWRVAEIVEKAK